MLTLMATLLMIDTTYIALRLYLRLYYVEKTKEQTKENH